MLQNPRPRQPIATPAITQQVEQVEGVHFQLHHLTAERDALPDGRDRRVGPRFPAAVARRDPAALAAETGRLLEKLLERGGLPRHRHRIGWAGPLPDKRVESDFGGVKGIARDIDRVVGVGTVRIEVAAPGGAGGEVSEGTS